MSGTLGSPLSAAFELIISQISGFPWTNKWQEAEIMHGTMFHHTLFHQCIVQKFWSEIQTCPTVLIFWFPQVIFDFNEFISWFPPIIVQVVGTKIYSILLYIFIILVCIGLVGAYATGSCRKIETSIKASAVVVIAVLVFILVLVGIITYIYDHIEGSWLGKLLEGTSSYIKGTKWWQFLASYGRYGEHNYPSFPPANF